MGSYTVKNLTFTYPGRRTPALRDLNLTIETGAFITLIGPSGSGKTTLLKMLKPTLAPHGAFSGGVYFAGAPVTNLGHRTESTEIGFVAQNPEQQIVTDTVWHELAFGLESLGYDTPSIRLRVAEMASFFGLQNWFHKSVSALSGGQKQLLCLAAVMAMQPSVLILDEPTGQLDPIAAAEFLAAVGKINRELGVTVIMTEHRLEEVFPLTDQVVVLDAGRIIAADSPARIGAILKEKRRDLCPALPVPMRVYAAVDSAPPCPVTIRDGRRWLSRQKIDPHGLSMADQATEIPRAGNPTVRLDEVWFRYEKDLPDVIKGLSFKAYAGEITAVLGGNGTGKTTMLSLISGINQPHRGKVRNTGSVGMLPQNPQALFVGQTVREDLYEAFAGTDVNRATQKEHIETIVGLCRLGKLLPHHPYDLSGGEQQRAALAKVLLLKPRVLLLDEPTKGLDAGFKLVLAGILRQLADTGVTVIMVSHDLEFCAEHADRCALFFDGHIVSTGRPRAFFAGHSFYTSAANRMARHVLPRAITAGDVITALGGHTGNGGGIPETGNRQDAKEPVKPTHPQNKMDASAKTEKHPPRTRVPRLPSPTIMALAVVLLAIPLTIYAGLTFFGDRKYFLISTLVLLQAMVPFALVFESRKPQAGELMTVAVLCALGVAGRLAFFMLPQFKPVLAIVVITGVAFGAETGFLVGAMTAFVSNMFLGQGPWTPWQMFAYGIVGLLAGLLFQKNRRRQNRTILAAFGGLAALFIFGPITNASAIFTFQLKPTLEMFYVAAARGLPFDLIHAAATAVFLFLLARPLLEKLDRVQQKYGLLE